MVDVAELPSAARMKDEIQQISQAIGELDSGERINAMTIGAVTVPTDTIPYPPPMIDAIKTALWNRQGELTQELQNMGVSFGEPEGGGEGGEEPEPQRRR